MSDRKERFDVAAIYFPSWHADPRNEKLHGKGWTEWELVKNARPLYERHRQPRVPAWGYFDEASVEYAERQIDLAADHGITVFHVDWYWYEGGPYLNRPLDEALLRASNNHRMKFGIMWANHDWKHIFPMPRSKEKAMIFPSEYDDKAMEGLVDEWIEKYLSHPRIWTIEGKPVVSIFDLNDMVGKIGIEGAKRLLDRFEERLSRAGLPGLHWNVMGFYHEAEDRLEELGIASATNYQTIWDETYGANIGDPENVFDPRAPKRQNFADSLPKAEAHWEKMAGKLRIPYYPILTQGWDSSPRGEQFDGAGAVMEGYPWYPVVENNTPANFERAARMARDFALRQPYAHKIVYVNAWNEWTEGSYLLPDIEYGNAYLEAIKRVFGVQAAAGSATKEGAASDA
ncbi:glycoside hydrolase family 99-like domain-containing protein [Cohnella sp. GCM10020058]|uniref:glycosyltransferase WbsX family protein n=1 Tax=Cohnella sp. GCM10020058 TaxID=3317330 RepID=UPI003644365F